MIRLKIKDYMREKGGKILNRGEAQYFGLEYPLKENWLDEYENLQIPNDSIRKLKYGTLGGISQIAKESKSQTTDKVINIEPSKRKAKQKKTKTKNKKYFNSKILSDEFLSSYEWRKLRLVVLMKYGSKCQCCGATPKTGSVMNVDHIKPRKLFPELALVESNLQVLCAECNHGKGNWCMKDFR